MESTSEKEEKPKSTLIANIDSARGRLRERLKLVREDLAGKVGDVGVGKGNFIERIFSRVENLTTRVKERTGNIMPKVSEKIQTFKPLEKITGILPKPAQPDQNEGGKSPQEEPPKKQNTPQPRKVRTQSRHIGVSLP